jgi:hypothetical protein
MVKGSWLEVYGSGLVLHGSGLGVYGLRVYDSWVWDLGFGVYAQ